ncbi:MAG: BamA/TamA family outer membrane protein [Acidobacteriota bacterium]|nr:BamA/TamA family outer membrane protein [Acidobacteriota bacterium]
MQFRFLAAALLTCGLSFAQQFEGKPIFVISFDPPVQPLDPAELYAILPLKKNKPLHIADVRASIERLYATGRYQDIEVDALPAPGDQVAIQFRTKNSWFIGHVSVSGDVSDPPNPGQLVNASRLFLGTPFDKADVKTAQGNISRLLISNGFYESTVTPKIKYSDIAQQANIDFEIQPGKRARFSMPQLTGNLQVPEKRIIRATHWKKRFRNTWQPITQARVRQGLDGVRDQFEKADRLLATVQLKSLDYNKTDQSATPHLEIEAGPRVQIRAIGAKVKRKVLQENVPVFQEHTVDNDLLQEGRRNLREEFQSKGYFEAEVEFKEKRVVNGKEEIDYLINPGERHRFVKLTIEGNKYFTTEAIRERMFLQPKSFQFPRGRYSEAFTRRDEDSIANLYKSNGFRDVVVSANTKDDYAGKVGDIAVAIKITEGVQYIVSSLEVTGQEKLSLATILPALSSAEDQPFSEFNVATDRNTILTYYFENGFPNAAFEYSTSTGAKPNLVELSFKITEGNRQTVRQVITSGLVHTKERLVNGQISLSPGDPLSPVQMSETQRRLYDLGVFAQVNMAVQNPDGETERKYVLYDMEEARRYSLTAGFGAQIANIGGSNAATSLSDPAGRSGFSPRVSLDLTRINFLGIGQTLSFRSRYSSLDRRGLVDYLAPRIFGRPKLDLNLTVLYDRSNDVRTFSATREEASAQITDRISKSLTAFYRFSYRNVTVGALKIDPLLLPRFSQSVRIGIASVNLIQDRRDDPTDAHKGMYNTIDFGFATKAFGSQAGFLRVLGRNATYHRVGRKYVLARQTSLGLQPSYETRKGFVPTPNDSDPIPLPERFYGGGGNSMRGFPENQAGPRDQRTGFPLGGSALLFNSTELRFPFIGENIGGALFHDFGNIFDKPSDISFRFSQKNLTDFNYMVHAVGAGVRYRTPIGPVRLDLAYSINAPKFNGFGGTYNDLVTCSRDNTCVQSVQRVSRLQFFFSIGQAF